MEKIREINDEELESTAGGTCSTCYKFLDKAGFEKLIPPQYIQDLKDALLNDRLEEANNILERVYAEANDKDTRRYIAGAVFMLKWGTNN